MTREHIACLVHLFEPFHAARGGNVAENLDAWGREFEVTEATLDLMWSYLGCFVITDSACLDPAVMAYWWGQSNPQVVE